MLVALNTISYKQLKNTQETVKQVVQILNYSATYPEAVTRYHAIRMNLHMHSNALFLSAPGAKSIPGWYHYLSEPFSDPKKPPHNPPLINGPIHMERTTMKNFLVSSMEAELGA